MRAANSNTGLHVVSVLLAGSKLLDWCPEMYCNKVASVSSAPLFIYSMVLDV